MATRVPKLVCLALLCLTPATLTVRSRPGVSLGRPSTEVGCPRDSTAKEPPCPWWWRKGRRLLLVADTCRRRRVDLWLATKASELTARIWPSTCRGACLPVHALCNTLWFAMVCGRCATRCALGAREYGIWCAVAEEWCVGACARLAALPLSLVGAM